jgi:hypothetical protein
VSGGSLPARAWSAALAIWRAFIGATIAITASIPFLVRIDRRFGTWIAPATALAVMAAAFSLSSFVIGATITGGNERSPQPAGHDSHH